MVKWAVTVNMALAGASVTLRQDVNAKRLFCLLAFGVVFLSVLLMWEITRRMISGRTRRSHQARCYFRRYAVG
jgi:hypothetical protein